MTQNQSVVLYAPPLNLFSFFRNILQIVNNYTKQLSTIEQSNKSPQENIGQVNNFLFLCFQFFLLFNILMLVKSCYVLVLNYFKTTPFPLFFISILLFLLFFFF